MPTRTNLTIGRRSKSYPCCGSRGGVWWTTFSFRYVTVLWKHFTFSRKPYKMRDTLWVRCCWGPVTSSKEATILIAFLDSTQNQKLLKNGAFWCWTCIIWRTVNILCFFHPKRVKNTHFPSQMAWPLATYDVVSRNHSNRLLSNLYQNVSRNYTHSYWKRQV